jgi:hypothetical protein
MKTSKLTADQERLLREQVIDADHPGPILHDFGVLLDYVASHDLQVAGKYNLLPMSVLGELDERLSRPLRLQATMKRPQLRSHPYLQGLYLLLRATGLGRVDGVGAKARLKLDADLLSQWQDLNPTERYFTLLEAWLLVGQAEMVGDRGSSWASALLTSVLMAWKDLPAEGKRIDAAHSREFYIWGIGKDLYHLALMDLFGLVEVVHPRQPVQPWCPAVINHVAFGDAVFRLLARHESQDLFGPVGEDEEAEPEAFGELQPVFQPFFPQWQQNLKWESPAAHEGVYVFKVSLGKVWRRLAMPADATLDDLADWILDSVDFDDEHLYEFRFRNRLGVTVRVAHPYADESPATDEMEVGELPLEPGQAMDFVYDFGDNWQFKVLLESIEPPGTKKKKPALLEKHGKAPEQYPYYE